jgi:2-methylcitrate dehydratase PrpD
MATVLTYEVFCKIMDVLDNQESGVDHSTITGFAAVVGATVAQAAVEARQFFKDPGQI